MKNTIMSVAVILLFVNLLFAYSWCYILEKNQKMLIEQIGNYQQSNFERNERQDKEIRLLKQDLSIIEKGGKYD